MFTVKLQIKCYFNYTFSTKKATVESVLNTMLLS